MTPERKKNLSIALKATIVLLAFYFIYVKVSHNSNLQDFRNLLKAFSNETIILLLGLVFLLMFVNWGFEVVKWKRLIQKVEKISFWRATESVFCGLTLAVFTPNRIGEYGGRVFFLSPKRRIVGIVAMAVGNIGQMVITNCFGAIATCFFIAKFVDLNYILFYILLFVASAFIAFMLVFYFNIQWIKGILTSFKFTKRYEKFYRILGRYKSKELLNILFVCFARYTMFSLQYLILIRWLIPGLNTPEVLMMLSILFFVQSTLPSLAIFDIGVRSLTATYFFGFITSNSVAIIAITACVWLVNIIIPAILGSYFVFKLNFFGTIKRR